MRGPSNKHFFFIFNTNEFILLPLNLDNMEKLYGILSGLGLIISGAIVLSIGLSPVYASALIITGLGISLMFERKVIKETSTLLEKKISTTSPIVAEIAVIGGIVTVYGLYIPFLIYLGLLLLKIELFTGLSKFSEINSSRLMGRISRIMILGLGIGLGYITDYLVFYAIVAAGLTITYDLLVILHESASSI